MDQVEIFLNYIQKLSNEIQQKNGGGGGHCLICSYRYSGKQTARRKIDKVMNEFAKSLGVDCKFCHVQIDSTNWDMASDQKPEKSVARKMIKMANKINKDFFKAKTKYGEEDAVLEIRCLTCHRGEPHPEIEQQPAEKSNQ